MGIGLTDAERAVYVPGRGVKTDGVKNFTTRHLNLTRSLAEVYLIVQHPQGNWMWELRPLPIGYPDA